MSKAINIAPSEVGLIRLFALSLSDDEARQLKEDNDAKPHPVELALGATSLNRAHIEVFAIADLASMPLADYLIEGPGAEETAIEPDRAKLAALEGWVMIVYSSAFAGHKLTISPVPELTLIGTYPQDGIDWSSRVDLSTPSAKPQSTSTGSGKKQSDAAMSGRIATLALIVAFGVVALMVWVAS
ncbi:MAG: hypothetical protein AAGF27_04930 [Pseudomonadota bacterium]